jgi:hypothetical protein
MEMPFPPKVAETQEPESTVQACLCSLGANAALPAGNCVIRCPQQAFKRFCHASQTKHSNMRVSWQVENHDRTNALHSQISMCIVKTTLQTSALR